MSTTKTPVTCEQAATRLARVRERMREKGVAVAVFYSAPYGLGANTVTSGITRYLVGWADPEQPSVLILPGDGTPTLIVSGWEPIRELAVERVDAPIHIELAEDRTALGSLIAARVSDYASRDQPVGTVGLDEMSLSTYTSMSRELARARLKDALVDFDYDLHCILLVRDSAEIDLLRKAASISDAMISTGLYGAATPNKYASQILADMIWAGNSMEAEHVKAWLSLGEVLGQPLMGLSQIREVVQPGYRVNVGTQLAYEGYWGHSIRMGYRGKPPAELIEYADIALRAQAAAMVRMIPGESLRRAVDAMNAILDENAPLPADKDELRTRPGHGLGLHYSEPILSDAFSSHAPSSDLALAEGMVFELHPSFGVPGFGLIVKGDAVAVGPNGAEFLNNVPRPLTEL